MGLFRSSVEQMQGYVPGEQPKDGTRVVKLNTNENPYPPSPTVARAVLDELAEEGEKLRLYSDPGAFELRRAASEVTGFPVEQILHGNGSDELLALLIRACLEEGEAVAYPWPTYTLYETLARSVGAPIRTVSFADDFALPDDLLGIEAKLVFVASPNSPSGTRHDNERLRALARSLPGLLVIDEAYADFASDNALELARELDNVVVLRTFSKSYSLAGMRVGLLFGAGAVISALAKVKDSYNLDRLAIAAAAAALRDQSWMRDNVRKICATRDRLTQALSELDFRVLPSEANFVFARAASPERAGQLFEQLKQRRILVRYFPTPELGDGLRITVGTDAEVDELLSALGELR